ncbi:hypothetical protein [Hymenobacter sp. YC55]|uniref:hypothetical protein n=1 Tax=Hymenobacter sp. YC55 TaxID=3034019 RepID=UPI0023F6D42B|nr:hypothetical protein [Hymenobacter sp. YC55]MDF7813628.1 hypothetical protein [Hymenobacter sp. YC55]
MIRTASRVDANQKQIVTALRQIGASVLHVHQLKNCFDILVGYRGRTFLIEIKTSEKEKLTDGEAEFKASWRGSEYHIVYSVDQAIRLVTAPALPTMKTNCLCQTSTASLIS